MQHWLNSGKYFLVGDEGGHCRLHSLLTTTISILPSCYMLFRRPTVRNFYISLVNTLDEHEQDNVGYFLSSSMSLCASSYSRFTFMKRLFYSPACKNDPFTGQSSFTDLLSPRPIILLAGNYPVESFTFLQFALIRSETLCFFSQASCSP